MSTPVAAIRTEEIAFNGTETKPCFLIKGELSNAGVSSSDDHAPNRRAEQLGEPCFNHLLTNSAALQRRIDSDWLQLNLVSIADRGERPFHFIILQRRATDQRLIRIHA